MQSAALAALQPYLRSDAVVDCTRSGIPRCAWHRHTPALAANSAYFGHVPWARDYLQGCHRTAAFRTRWLAATGRWDGRIVVDIGCGPGNVYATLGGNPALLIGVDVADGALQIARELGYVPLLADAQALPLVSGFADIVAVNATLHHCDDMTVALAEAARLVKPGGILIVDHDPQLTAWHFKGVARLAWNLRVYPYRWTKKGFHRSRSEQSMALQGEVHHQPGCGVTRELFESVLRPAFDVRLYFHNHDVGDDALNGERGQSAWKYRLAQRLSGVDPSTADAALSIMCVATRLPVMRAEALASHDGASAGARETASE
jgi:SAM-dependent methyltransferase